MTLPARTLDTPDSLPAAGEARVPATKPGAIVLTRHGEPALSRKCMLTSDQYRDWWARYEVGGLRPGQTPRKKQIHSVQRIGRFDNDICQCAGRCGIAVIWWIKATCRASGN